MSKKKLKLLNGKMSLNSSTVVTKIHRTLDIVFIDGWMLSTVLSKKQKIHLYIFCLKNCKLVCDYVQLCITLVFAQGFCDIWERDREEHLLEHMLESEIEEMCI